MPRFNAFSRNLKFLNLKIFPAHGELHKLERKFNKHPGEKVKGLMSSQKYERMYP